MIVVPALAQGSDSALRGHNTDAPVNWAADRVEVLDQAGKVILSGNVVARQDTLTLTAPRVTVAYTRKGGVDVSRIDATGGVVVRSPSETARGQLGIYDLERKLITLVGGVTLARADTNVSGARLVLDLRTGRAVMDGGTAPAAGSLGTRTQGGRVTGTFTVPQQK